MEELKQLVAKKLQLLHKTNPTLQILYNAIEQCSNGDFIYYRDIVLDMANNNESFINEKDGNFYYLNTDERFFKDINRSYIDGTIEILTEENLDFSIEKDINILNEIVERDYKAFVFFYLTLCLKTYDKTNDTIDEFIFI